MVPPLHEDASADRGADDSERSERPISHVTGAKDAKTQALLARARAGSNAVWQVFYDRYRDFLIYQVRVKFPGFARRQFDAEDVLQSAFTAAWKNVLKFQYTGEGSFRRYLSKIVLNQFRNQLKKADRQGRHFAAEDEQFGSNQLDDTDAGAMDPARICDVKEFLQVALDKLRELDEEDQEVLGMRVYEGMTWTDMGQVLGCDRETAKERFLRALKRLQRRVYDRAS